MATSPAPDAAAPPGMCPGIAVLGGGGGSGDGDGDGNGGKRGSAGNGDGDGDGAGSDGKNAQGCGSGSGSGCTNPKHGGGGRTAAGDPIDIGTGRVYTLPAIDLALGGPLALLLERVYSTAAADRDVGLGYGWSHSLAWEVHARRRRVELVRHDGNIDVATIPELGGHVALGDGATLARHPWGFALTTNDGLVRFFRCIHTTAQGRNRYVLTSIADRNENRINLVYRDGSLRAVIDSANRFVRVRRDERGRITAFETKNNPHQGKWVAFRSYEYDTYGNLVAAVEAQGHATRFAYNEEHLLTTQIYAAGLHVFYRYDRARRCVETWAEHPGQLDPALDDDLPSCLADGSPAKGMFHNKLDFGPDGFVAVTDSRQVRRYKANGLGRIERAVSGGHVESSTFDTRGELVSYENPEGALWTWQRDEDGRLLATVDPLGTTTSYSYDEKGRCTAITTGCGNVIAREYDDRNNLVAISDVLGDVIRYELDARGQLIGARGPRGDTTRITVDAHGNRIEVVEPNGATRRMQYDYFGRITSMLDEHGRETRYLYDDNGLLAATISEGGAKQMLVRDAEGRVIRITDPDGRVYQLRWSGLNLVHEVLKPDGACIRYRYDREGALVKIINERGEVHRLVRDRAGRIREEHTFDGRVISYRDDASGYIKTVTNAAGEVSQLARDPLGRLISRTYHDDRVDAFDYDAMGRVVSASSGDVTVTFQYDARGRRVRETLAIEGELYSVESEYDMGDRRVLKRTSLGYEERCERDVMGAPSRLFMGDEEPITFCRDAMGDEIERILPGGGRVQTKCGPFGQRERVRVVCAGARRARVGEGEPEWVGALPDSTVDQQSCYFSPAGELLEEHELDGNITRYKHDALGQVLERLPSHVRAEFYRYDEATNIHEAGTGAQRREYGPGGKLVRRGATEYVYDDDARLIAKHEQQEDGTVRTTKLRWASSGLLEAVVTPDGGTVEFMYDAFARRVAKRTTRPEGTREVTHFVHDGAFLTHEVRKRVVGGGETIIEERTYAFEPGTFAPVAHRDAVRCGGARVHSPAVYYVNDTRYAPRLLLSSSGDVLAKLSTSVWGRLESDSETTTPLRLVGQYEDPETKLAYNRYRYYDAETGRYVCRDPIGLEGGLWAFTYVRNRPYRLMDPYGLVDTTITPPIGGEPPSCSSGTSGAGIAIHPVVAAAIPPTAGDPPIYPSYDSGDRKAVPPGRPPTTCAEPRAISERIRAYERANGLPENSLQPGDPRVAQALNGMHVASTDESGARAPCPNCSQLMANLQAQNNCTFTVASGYGPPTDPGVLRNFTQPNGQWLQAQNAAYIMNDASLSQNPNYQPFINYGRPTYQR
ncbi:RHS repeat-associated core domain-containing protein [Sorangium sp. So ce590]|uniref:RHS repeat-associated core domain-containing protein n=1 Tax=Sorangium sp. So ce590 TaxID=3133317 RepID=UPI003F62436C